MRALILVLLALFIVLQYSLWFGDASLPDAWRLKEKIALQREENARLTERNRVLESEIKDLKYGLAVVEEKARSELGMIKPGETYYQIVETPAKKDKR